MAATRLHSILLKNQVGRGSAFTHTSLGKPLGSFYIPVDVLGDFIKAYADAIDVGEEIYITEKHRHLAPILIDLDFRFPGKLVTRRYTEDTILQICRIYAEEASTLFQLSKFTFYILEKPNPTKTGKDQDNKQIKDGLHIVIPDLCSKPSAQYALRNLVLQRLTPIFEELGVANKITDIVDEAVIERNNWMMYGSRKPGGDPYKVTQVLQYDAGELTNITNSTDLSTQTLVQVLSIRNKFDETCIKSTAGNQIAIYEQIIEQRRRKMECSRVIISQTETIDENTCSNFEQICSLVDILSEERANNYNDWMRLGWCLRNIDHRLLNKWDQFSQKSPKYKPGECDHLWRHMRITKGGLGIGTLYMWAKQDSPQAYDEIVRTNLKRLLLESRSGTHTDIARVVYELYGKEYVCSNIKGRTWFEFKNHKWNFCDSGTGLRSKLSDQVWSEYTRASGDLHHQASNRASQEDRDKLIEAAERLINVANKLKIAGFKDNVMRECAELFYQEKFEEKLDSNPSLIGFENGVYDLDTMEFREGRPEDYISFTTETNFVPYDVTHPYINGIKGYLGQVLTNAEIREYVMKLFASFLHGTVKEQKFHIWTGSGCHAYNTKIIMANGGTKYVQDVGIGDQLMGDDGNPRKVLQLFRGTAPLYQINVDGMNMLVNGDHVLSIKIHKTMTMTTNWYEDKEVTILEWIHFDPVQVLKRKRAQFNNVTEALQYRQYIVSDPYFVPEGGVVDVILTRYLQYIHKRFDVSMWRAVVDYPVQPVPINPTECGALLLKTYFREDMKRSSPIDFESLLPVYLWNSIEVRQLFFDALIDYSLDDWTCVILQVASKKMGTHELDHIVSHIKTIANSLNISCYYDKITGKLTFNKVNLKFDVNLTVQGEYFGFELNSNHRYLDEHSIVHHNSNSKSKLVELYEKAFGNYCCKFPITLLTMKRAASNAATSELARAKGKRFASLQEPSEGEQINCGFMKELSGGDKIMARSLFKEPIEFVPQFKMVLLCNHLPLVPSDDGGTWRRIRVVEFTSRFVDNPVEDNEFPIDTELSEKLELWKEHFMSMLLEYYKLYKLEGISEPNDVLQCTREYKRQNDHLADYIFQNVEKKDGAFLTINEAFHDLRAWIRDDHIPIAKVPTKSDFEKYLAKHFACKCVSVNNNKGFRGYAIKQKGTFEEVE
jgi:P4 family phage/plasmid primase-like protien